MPTATGRNAGRTSHHPAGAFVRGSMGGMKAKRPTPPECPVCTSREVVTRGSLFLPAGIYKAATASPFNVLVTGRKRTPKPKPKPKVIRYRCRQCGHKFTVSKK